MRRKKIKLQNLDAEIRATAGDCPPIFRGVVAHVNGYTQPSLQDLHRMIVSRGGGFLQYLDGKTAATHIIASSLTPKKREEFRRYRIVKPAWVTESIRAGRLLPWDEFRVVDEGQSQKVLKFNDGRFVSQTNSPRLGYKEESRASWYNTQLKVIAGTDESPDSFPSPATTPTPAKGFNRLPSQPSQSDYGDFPSFTTFKEKEKAPSPRPEAETLLSLEAQTLATHDDPSPPSVAPLMDTAEVSYDSKQPSSPKTEMTSEDYNAQLLSDPRVRKSSVVNPEFLQQYYKESRLHHLSTWKADLKAQLQAATKEKTQSCISQKRPVSGGRRYILHVDFDSFFAAVSLLKYPELRDKPVAVAHSPGDRKSVV